MKTHHGIIEMLTSKYTWIVVTAGFILLNYFVWLERVEWLRSLP